MVLGLTACSHDSSISPPSAPADSTSGRSVTAQRVLSDLVDALATGDSAKAAGVGVGDGKHVLEAMVANVAALNLTDLSMRFVDDQEVLGTDDRELYGASAWGASVELTYRFSEWDVQPTRLETRVVFVPASSGDRIAAIGGGDERTPLWVDGPVMPVSSGRALVLVRGSGAQRYLELARQALVDVAKVLPAWRGKLVVEAPSSEAELDQALAAPQDRYANIAAVTTTVDGSLVPGAPVHVFLNPRVFDALGPRGSQVVISHETTHVATDATFQDIPTWLLEGFADYVALAHAGIPVNIAASQILARIRKDGPPDHLPTASDLDPSATGLGATYEEAWLATRFISREYGEHKLVAFYRQVGAGERITDAFGTVLGTTEAAFVKRWRADLRDLAGGMAG
jgi:hypothetical protein